MVENDNDRRALAARKEKIADEVLDLIGEVCDDDAVRDERDLDLFEAGLLDSLAAIELLVGIEERFGVDIAPTAVERSEMNTPNKIIYQIAVRL
ncbi:D-alanine--poly(phosphoribitol) ligase subunit DltC [Collinsella sp. An307]|uniref:D-alanine--poly(phosphoribitol) ligase subunit DltC n=1 Tax=Collinsella sp. An307 TaxID=1965630 RepID=UPI000B397740|nr:D-alanine--poly(phosphoribitol) ligase subunit DltC [Collinsella sp. An307]OUO22327.1 D-alanine--poly(phosphoribitol) ligase subunit 2 [Collinsella sp. An307]